MNEQGRRGAAGVHLPTLRPRVPIAGTWPLEMRADVLAALLDFPDTDALVDAILRSEAPRPTVMRRAGTKSEPVWSLSAVQAFLERRHGGEALPGRRNLARMMSHSTEKMVNGGPPNEY